MLTEAADRSWTFLVVVDNPEHPSWTYQILAARGDFDIFFTVTSVNNMPAANLVSDQPRCCRPSLCCRSWSLQRAPPSTQPCPRRFDSRRNSEASRPKAHQHCRCVKVGLVASKCLQTEWFRADLSAGWHRDVRLPCRYPTEF
jgi:hypothetical protein